MKTFIVSMILMLTANQFIMGQDTLARQESTSVIGTPHKFVSPSLKMDTASPGFETQFCKSCHDTKINEQIEMDSALTEIKQSKSFFQMFGNYQFNVCPKCTKVYSPDGISSSCLSCHDGSIAQNRAARQPGNVPGNETINLFNSHPISFVYDTLQNKELWPINHVYNDTNTVKDLLDANNEVQCTSCHNMHNNEFGYLLKMNNEKSALCLACHIR